VGINSFCRLLLYENTIKDNNVKQTASDTASKENIKSKSLSTVMLLVGTGFCMWALNFDSNPMFIGGVLIAAIGFII
jgi:hypothetical protein